MRTAVAIALILVVSMTVSSKQASKSHGIEAICLTMLTHPDVIERNKTSWKFVGDQSPNKSQVLDSMVAKMKSDKKKVRLWFNSTYAPSVMVYIQTVVIANPPNWVTEEDYVYFCDSIGTPYGRDFAITLLSGLPAEKRKRIIEKSFRMPKMPIKPPLSGK